MIFLPFITAVSFHARHIWKLKRLQCSISCKASSGSACLHNPYGKLKRERSDMMLCFDWTCVDGWGERGMIHALMTE